MGISAGLGTLLAAGVGAVSSAHTQSANAAAQADINRETMDFNSKEAAKARDWEHNEAAINRLFNQRSANTAMQFSKNEAEIERSFNAAEASKARSWETSEAAKARSWSSGEAQIARQFDAQQALLARQFEQRMSNTAHQREVADLRAAGLNPILSATGGAGASTPVAPVIGAPLPSASKGSGFSASGHGGQGFSATGQTAKGVAAAIGGLNAYMKKDVFSQFVNSAIDGFRLDNDIKRAKAEDMHAHAHLMDSFTNLRRQISDHLVNMERKTNIHEDTLLKKWQSISEEKQVHLIEEKIRTELGLQKLHGAQAEAVKISASAAATAASAQAHMAQIQDEIQHAESPERVKLLQKQADYWQSEFDKNKWVMDDPEVIMKRDWWKNNQGAVGVKETSEILGKIFHVGIGLHGIIPMGGSSGGYQDSKIGF